jgi:CubicO group peptidase (beta-lactamase class C family)
MTTAHRFRIASHSKTFTAAAVVRLAEHGALRLDDPVGQWVDELATAPIARVTLRELLAHGSGIVRDGWDGDFWQLYRAFPDAAGLLDVANDEAIVLGRNERFKYSNVGYSLLGRVIERATGSTYAEHVRVALIDPLGLAATAPDIDPAAVSDHATGYSALAYADRRLPIDHIATGAMAPATGFSSTATDLVRWASAHFFGDTRVLSDDAKRLMQRKEWTVEGASSSYGLGLAIAEPGGRRMLGHGGGFPGFITQTWFDPVERLAVAVLTNAIDGPAEPLATAAVRVTDLALRPPDGHPASTDAERFCGRFATLWGVADVVSLDGRLYLFDPLAVDPVAEPHHLRAVDDRTLLITRAPGYRSPGERLVYEFADDGAVRSLRGGSGATWYPHDSFVAAVAARQRVRLGDPLRPPSM